MTRALLSLLIAGLGADLAGGLALAAPPQSPASAPLEVRKIAWTGSDRLQLAGLAEVTFIQGPSPEIILSGPSAVLDRVKIHGGKIEVDGRCSRTVAMPRAGDCVDGADVKIQVTGPATTRFDLSGASRLAILGYDQPKLDMALSGLATAEVEGRTDQVKLDASGGGEADLSRMVVKTASINLSGLGRARIGPSEKARIDISGGGELDLLSHPATLKSRVTGKGHIRPS